MKFYNILNVNKLYFLESSAELCSSIGVIWLATARYSMKLDFVCLFVQKYVINMVLFWSSVRQPSKNLNSASSVRIMLMNLVFIL